MSSSKRTNLNSTVQLRTTCDEAMSATMSSLGYDESFNLIDLKLAIGYSGAAIAGMLYFLDKKYSFKDIYSVTVVCVVLYGILSVILFFLNFGTYKNNKYIGKNKESQKIYISTWVEDPEPIYHLKLKIYDGSTSKFSETKINFSEVFNTFGYLQEDIFTKKIKEEIETLIKRSK